MNGQLGLLTGISKVLLSTLSVIARLKSILLLSAPNFIDVWGSWYRCHLLARSRIPGQRLRSRVCFKPGFCIDTRKNAGQYGAKQAQQQDIASCGDHDQHANPDSREQ